MKRKKIVIFSIVAFIVVLSGGTGLTLGLNGYFGGGGEIPSDSLTRGLIGYWAFEEGTGTTANDASGQGNTGTLTNMDPSTDWVSGKAGNGSALDFGIETDEKYVTSASLQTLIEDTDKVTISAWVKASNLSSIKIITDTSLTSRLRLSTNGGNAVFNIAKVYKNFFVNVFGFVLVEMGNFQVIG